MIITAQDLLDIEHAVGHGCTASVRIDHSGTGLRVSAHHPVTGHQITFEQIITPEAAQHRATEDLLIEFRDGAARAIGREMVARHKLEAPNK